MNEGYSEIMSIMSEVLDLLKNGNVSTELYKDYLLRWYELYKLPKNCKYTNDFMYYYITKRINPVLGDIPLNKLSGDVIQKYLSGIKENNTRIKIGQIIKGSLAKAVKLRLLMYNPFDAVEVLNYKKVHYRAVTLEEQSILLGTIKNPLYFSVFYIMVCTGLRIGEFLALDSQSVSFDKRYLAVRRTVNIQTGELQNRTKTYTSKRKVPFLKELTPFLKILLTYVKDNGLLSYNQVKKYFQKTMKKNNISGLNLHSFRHTFGCMCYRAGIKDKTIQRLMGHASLDTTMNTYVDVMGGGFSPLDRYFEKYKKEVESRPTDFWLNLGV